MSLSVGIVGLPNVGKSTLFNALLKKQVALAANYPFATIEPNVGIAEVPDDRLAKLADVVRTTVIKPATVEFVDIAGLVSGASKGEGLGNQFLSHIRETDAICHVLRDFADSSIIREGAVNPVEDLATVRMELQLADLATIDKQPEPKGRAAKELQEKWQVIQLFRAALEQGQGALSVVESVTGRQLELVTQAAKELSLLTAKPEIFVINLDEDQLANYEELLTKFANQLAVDRHQVVLVSAKVESELAALSPTDQSLFLTELGVNKSGLERLAEVAYQTLGLQSFLTAGEKEVRAWTIKQGTTAPQAAGVIHTDFIKHFIKARVADYDLFIKLGGWKALKEQGKLRLEGREYVMRSQDVVEFMIGST